MVLPGTPFWRDPWPAGGDQPCRDEVSQCQQAFLQGEKTRRRQGAQRLRNGPRRREPLTPPRLQRLGLLHPLAQPVSKAKRPHRPSPDDGHRAAVSPPWARCVPSILDWQPTPPEELEDRLRLLDGFYIPTRYPDSYPEGTPSEHFGRLQSEQALLHAGAIITWVRAALAHRS